MNKILMSTLAIVAVVAVAGVGSWAMWFHTETSNNNYVKSGSMYMEFNSEDGTYGWTDTLPGTIVHVEDAYPGVQDSGAIQVRNTGDTVDGTLIVSLENIRSIENGLVDPERDMGDSGPDGELCEEVEVRWVFDRDETSVESNWKSINTATTWNFGGNALLAKGTPGVAYVLEAQYRVPSGADNKIMTDKCLFDIVLNLEQN